MQDKFVVGGWVQSISKKKGGNFPFGEIGQIERSDRDGTICLKIQGGTHWFNNKDVQPLDVGSELKSVQFGDEAPMDIKAVQDKVNEAKQILASLEKQLDVVKGVAIKQ